MDSDRSLACAPECLGAGAIWAWAQLIALAWLHLLGLAHQLTGVLAWLGVIGLAWLIQYNVGFNVGWMQAPAASPTLVFP